MASADLISVSAAARELGVNAARVRAMLAAGRLDGRKVGGRWLVHSASVRRRRRERRGRGRSLTPANAWAVLFLASGENNPQISGSARSRLRRLLELRGGVEGLLDRFDQRASERSLVAHPGILRHLSSDQRIVLTGISAAGEYELGLSASDEVDAYVPAESVGDVMTTFALEEPRVGTAGNVRLRVVPEGIWPFRKHVAPLAVVALDLAQELDVRSSRIGLATLRRLDQEHRWRAASS